MNDYPEFLGYARVNGDVGVRNNVMVLSAMDNVNGVTKSIAKSVRGTLGVPIWYGRGQYQGDGGFGQDGDLAFKTLVGIGCNPNIHSLLVVSLESVSAHNLANTVNELTGKPVGAISVQQCGGSIETVAEGMRAAAEMVSIASEQRREEFPLSKLKIGVECGGSDTTSGLAANPTLGSVADRVVDSGGSVILSETAEILGAEHILAKRAVSQAVAQDITRMVQNVEREARARGLSIQDANPTQDNRAGGLTTIEEKSLGAIIKAGSRSVQGTLSYADRVMRQGLYVMDTPCPACESMTGLAAGGVQVILFATGKGNLIGSPLAPTIKVTGNPETREAMCDNIDLEIASVLEGTKNVDQAGEELLSLLVKVCSGKLTRSEILFQEEIAVSRVQPTISSFAYEVRENDPGSSAVKGEV